MIVTPGDKLGPYRIEAPLGQGGMGSVFRARDTRLDRDVAIKLINDAEHHARLISEARALASLNHPNILAIFDVGDNFIVTELIEGAPVKADGIRSAIDYAAQAADALAAAHALGIAHRDLKPANILLTKQRRIKIIDFGLAKSKVQKDGETMTLPGTLLGTAAYMSPEQVRGEEADARSDIFCLGVVLYELVANERPFRGDTAAHLMTAICDQEPAPLHDTVPPALQHIIYRCLEKNPDNRFQSAGDLAFALRNVTLTSSSQTPLRPKRAWIPARWKRPLAVAGLLAIGLLAGFAAAVWFAPGPRIPRNRLVTWSGRDAQPAISRDGRTVAFVSERDGASRVWLKLLATGEERAITAGPDEWPRISPDGASVLFIRIEQDGQRSLYTIPAIGGDPRKLLDGLIDADFSPDGAQIAFASWQGDGTVVSLMDANGSPAQEIVTIPGLRLEHPRWSPDGKSIALIGSEQGGYHSRVAIVDVDAKRHSVLPSGSVNAELSTVLWSPSGSEVYYLEQDGYFGDVRLVRQHRTSGVIVPLPWQYPSASLEVAGDEQILTASYSVRESLQELDITNPNAEAEWRARAYSTDRQPVYSPDGASILFVSTRGGNTDIWRSDVKTGAVSRLIEDDGEDIDPAFTPDGKSILWSSNRRLKGAPKDATPHFDIYIASTQGTQIRRITTGQFDAQNPTMTPDGQWIIYASSDPSQGGIWKIRPDGSQATRIAAGPFFLPEVSPDGQHALYLVNNGAASNEIRIVRIADGATVPFVIACRIYRQSFGVLGRARWMPDGSRIAFVAQNENGVNGVYTQPFVPGKDTASDRKLLFEPDPDAILMTFGISPNGRRVISSNWEQVSNLTITDNVPLRLRRPQ